MYIVPCAYLYEESRMGRKNKFIYPIFLLGKNIEDEQYLKKLEEICRERFKEISKNGPVVRIIINNNFATDKITSLVHLTLLNKIAKEEKNSLKLYLLTKIKILKLYLNIKFNKHFY